MDDKINYDDCSDEQLVMLFIEGYYRAADFLVERHRDYMFRSLHRFLRLSSEEKEDIVQDGFLKVFIAIDVGNYDTDQPFKPYLYQIIQNTAIDWINEQKKAATFEAEWKIYQQTMHLPSFMGVSPLALRDAMEQLTPRQRLVFKMRYLEDRSYREIAEELKIAESTARNIAKVARDTLYKILKNRIDPQNN